MKTIRLLYLMVVGLCLSCATNKLQINQLETPNVQSNDEIIQEIYLIGDAGEITQDSIWANHSRFVKNEFSKASDESVLLFLGDNIYPSGLEEEEGEKREKAKEILDAQLHLAEDFPGRVIFIPGNHDWYSSLKGLKEQEKYIESKLGKNSFLPENGCPIEKEKIGEDIVLLIVDSHWYITNWDLHPTINDDCEIKTRDLFWVELESEIKKARGKLTLVAVHHPLFSNGVHGGKYSFKSHLTPLPVLGSVKNLIRKTSGMVNADMQNKFYNEFINRMATLLQANDQAIVLSGHEHNLQYLERENTPQIISGSGSKTTPLKIGKKDIFGFASKGFAKLNIANDLSTEVVFYSTDLEEVVFEKTIFESRTQQAVLNYPKVNEKEKESSIFTQEETDKSGMYRWLWGERYRSLYSTPVKAPVLYLEDIHGGLVPIKKGGGHQSKSLRLQDSEGRQYVLRAMRKQATQFIQTSLFTQNYVQNQFEDTSAEALISDVFTGSFPYGSFIVGNLAEPIGVKHTNPVLYYVPKQAALGKFIDDFGDELYMLEEHTSEGHETLSGEKEILSTYEVLDKIHKNAGYSVDESNYIRARLLDLLIGDWDRHSDQWRWIDEEEKGSHRYVPIPRDRDQAFSKIADGALMGFANRMVYAAKYLLNYSPEIKNIKYATSQGHPMDMAFIREAQQEDFIREAQFIQTHIKDEIIEETFALLPPETLTGAEQEIMENLKKRRANLVQTAQQWQAYLAKNVVLTGTNKDDVFKINALENGNVHIEIFRNKKEGLISYFEKEYQASETKEIWIYGLDDKDEFKIEGKSKKIRLILVGGQNKDRYEVEYGKNIKIYDYRSKNNDFSEAKKARVKRNDTYETQVYDFKKLKNGQNALFPLLGFNPDDGFQLGFVDTYIQNGMERNPYTSKHQIKLGFYTATSGIDASYIGDYAHLFGALNLGIEARFTSDNFAENFFGYGNSTENISEEKQGKLDFYRVKIRQAHLRPSLVYRAHGGVELLGSVGYENMRVSPTPDRFLVTEWTQSEELFETLEYGNIGFRFFYENHDNPAFPTVGMKTEIELRYTNNLNESKQFSYIEPMFSFVLPLASNNRWVFASKTKARVTMGNDFEFFQAASIGGNNGLRGYNNQRFSGKHYLYENLDIRFTFNRLENRILPVSLGLFGGFDVGRVWIDDSRVAQTSFNSNEWNTSVGGGVFLNAVDMMSAQIGVFQSGDGIRATFGMGFGF